MGSGASADMVQKDGHDRPRHTSIVSVRCRNFAESRRRAAISGGHISEDMPVLVKAAAACHKRDRQNLLSSEKRDKLGLISCGDEHSDGGSRCPSRTTTASDDSSSRCPSTDESLDDTPES